MCDKNCAISSIPYYCGKWQFVNQATGEYRPFYCGGRSCGRPECISKFYKSRIRLISDCIKEFNLDKFYTLTLDPVSFRSDDEAWDKIADIWHRARTGIQRDYPGFHYISVLESHKKNSRPHIHGFTNTWIHQREWSKRWSACGGGIITWVERVEGDPQLYVCKELEIARYVGKDNLQNARQLAGHRKRTLWRSRIKTKAESKVNDVPSDWFLDKVIDHGE